MIKRGLCYAVIFTGLISLSTGNAFAARLAGEILMAKGAVTATGDDGVARFLGRGSPVSTGDRVATADKSFTVIRFRDNTKTTLRPNTEFVIEKYSHNDEGEDEAVFDLLRGGLRAVSGLIGKTNPDGFRVKTVATSIGIRGTAWDVRICEEGDDACAKDQELATQGKPSAAASLAETNCLDSVDLEGQPAGEYFAVYDGKIFIMRDGQTMELGAGDAGYSSRTAFGCLSTMPAFLLGDPIVFPDQVTENTPDFLELRCE
jgi:hypothetical protein